MCVDIFYYLINYFRKPLFFQRQKPVISVLDAPRRRQGRSLDIQRRVLMPPLRSDKKEADSFCGEQRIFDLLMYELGLNRLGSLQE